MFSNIKGSETFKNNTIIAKSRILRDKLLAFALMRRPWRDRHTIMHKCAYIKTLTTSKMAHVTASYFVSTYPPTPLMPTDNRVSNHTLCNILSYPTLRDLDKHQPPNWYFLVRIRLKGIEKSLRIYILRQPPAHIENRVDYENWGEGVVS